MPKAEHFFRKAENDYTHDVSPVGKINDPKVFKKIIEMEGMK
jgi:hypothetical protein